MEKTNYMMTVNDVAQELGVSKQNRKKVFGSICCVKMMYILSITENPIMWLLQTLPFIRRGMPHLLIMM